MLGKTRLVYGKTSFLKNRKHMRMRESWYLSLDILNKDYNDDFVCKFSYGVYRKNANDDISFEEAMNKADENVYAMKKELKAQRE